MPVALAARVRAAARRLRWRRQGDAAVHAGRDRDAPSPPRTRVARRSPRPSRPTGGKLPKPTHGAQGRQDLRRPRAHELRRVRDHARPQARAEDRRLVRLAGRQALLRRPDLPPHRPRLRDPGRRPARAPAPAAPATRSTEAPPEDLAYSKGVVAMAKTADRAAPARRAASSSSSPARTPGCRPSTRCSARSPRARRSSTRSASLEVGPDEAPTEPVVIRQIRIDRVLDPHGGALERRAARACAPARRRSCRAGRRPAARGGRARRSGSGWWRRRCRPRARRAGCRPDAASAP